MGSQISAMSVSGVTRALQRSLTEFSGKASQNNKNDNKLLEGASMVRQERQGGLTTSLPRPEPEVKIDLQDVIRQFGGKEAREGLFHSHSDQELLQKFF